MSEEVQGRIEKMIKKSEAILNAGKEKLKPCPFCGGNAQYDEDCFGRGLVQCKKCGAVIIDKYTYQDCIELWDNREVANRTWTQKVYDSFGEDGEQE